MSDCSIFCESLLLLYNLLLLCLLDAFYKKHYLPNRYLVQSLYQGYSYSKYTRIDSYHNASNVIVEDFSSYQVFWRIQSHHLAQHTLKVTDVGHLAQCNKVARGDTITTWNICYGWNNVNLQSKYCRKIMSKLGQLRLYTQISYFIFSCIHLFLMKMLQIHWKFYQNTHISEFD